MSETSNYRLHAFIQGRVQGVGFRYYVMQAAQDYHLTGWVRNLYDGRVEVVAEGPGTAPLPLGEHDFYMGYRKRLENKLRQKNQQISRTERLLKTLPEEQKPAFESLRAQSIEHRDEILEELEEIITILKTFKED